MSKYLLTDFELNGYDDSDFMCTYYDDVKHEVHAHMYGTTRCAAPTNIGWANGVSSVIVDGEACLAPTAEVVESARIWLEEHIFSRMVREDQRLVDEPDVPHLHVGLQVRVKEACKYALTTSQPCNKCSGSGKWINPKNSQDARDCFGCKGTGQHVTGKLKDDKGKQVWEKLVPGMFGSVVDWRSFGQFFSNGYNRPSPHNTTVQFRLDDGKIVRAGLSKLRLHRDYKTAQELRERANRLSLSYEFSGIYPGHAWDTHNFARAALETHPVTSQTA
jgi:hypothetical protein